MLSPPVDVHLLWTICFLSCLMALIGLGILTAVHKDKFAERTRYALSQSLRQNYRGPEAQGDTRDYSNSIDILQVKFECCGIDSSDDYNFNEWHRDYEAPDTGTVAVAKIPYTCCKFSFGSASTSNVDVSEVRKLLADGTCPLKPTAANSNAGEGCFDVIVRALSLYSQVLLGVFFTLGLLNLFGLVASVLLVLRLRRFDQLISNW